MKGNRIEIVDALRGFALIGIVLIHSIEHFDFFYPPELNFFFPQSTDQLIMEWAFILISGKAYSIFALMFGLSFFIQIDRHKGLGNNFSWRFIWRLTILLIFGFLHSLLYEGDILHIYAILGFLLVLFNKFNNKVLAIVAFLLALQIPLIYHLFHSFVDNNYIYEESFGSNLWGEAFNTYATGNLIDVIKYNIWKGRSAVWGWTIYNGRYLQLMSLFLIGLIAGREKIFENLEEKSYIIRKFLLTGAAAVIVLLLFSNSIGNSNFTETQLYIINKIIKSYTDLIITFFLVSSFILVYLKFRSLTVFKSLADYGRMSLSNYIAQSLCGVFIFYNFGLGMFRYMGSAWSLIYGVLFIIVQVSISRYWIKNYYYGPLEWVWRSLTYFNFSLKFKKISK